MGKGRWTDCSGLGGRGWKSCSFQTTEASSFQTLSPLSAVSPAPLPAPTTPSPLCEREAFDSNGLAGWGRGVERGPGKHCFLLSSSSMSPSPPCSHPLCCWPCCPQPALCRPLLAACFNRARLEIMPARSLGLLRGVGYLLCMGDAEVFIWLCNCVHVHHPVNSCDYTACEPLVWGLCVCGLVGVAECDDVIDC